MGYKRVVITEFGGPEVLKMIEETTLPEPKSGEVRVKVLERVGLSQTCGFVKAHILM